MGFATDFCVESTVQSALTNNFNIEVDGDEHTSGDSPHLNAEKVIEHYKWVWRNMIPTNRRITVENYEQIKNVCQKNL